MRNLQIKAILTIILIVLMTSLVTAELIRTSTPNIKATLISQDSDPVKQGEIVEVKFKIENNGTETSNDVIVEILPEFPFSLYSGEASRNLGKMRALQTGANSIIVSYKLKVDETAVEGKTEIKLKVLNTGSASNVYDGEDGFLIDIDKYDLPLIKSYIKESTILETGEKGNVIFGIANTGLGDAKFVQLTLTQTEDFEILSKSNYVYLGDIDSDDTESEEFEIFISSKADKEIILPVVIDYQDSNEIDHQVSFDLKLRTFSSSELQRFGLKKKSVFIPLILILIILAAVYFYWRHFRK